MPKAVQVGYGVLAALLIAAAVVVLLALVLDLGVIWALLLLGVIDVFIIIAGWHYAKRGAEADEKRR